MLHVTADDLGYSHERDAGILLLAAAGAVTRASLLVSGATARAALAAADALGLEVALHLNLTEGAPVAGAAAVPSLLAPGGGGAMRGKHGFRAALAAGAVAPAHIAAEALAQVQRFAALHPRGCAPRAFDGHQHVHVLPAVARALAGALAGRVAAARIPEWAGEAVEPLAHVEAARADFYRAVSADAAAARALYAAAGIAPLSARFVGLGASGSDCTAARARATLAAARASGGSVEWMVHPGFRTLRGGREEAAQEAAAQEALVAGGGAPFELRAERAAAWAGRGAAGAGCAGSAPDDFACSWEREREMAVLLLLHREGALAGLGSSAAAQ